MTHIKLIEPGGNFSDAVSIRFEVFVEEQNIDPEAELDEHDYEAHFAVLYDDGVPVACARVYFYANEARLGRVAVLRHARGRGYGAAVCERLLDLCRQNGTERVVLDSQSYAVPFYEKLGFTPCSGEFLEEGIPHIAMNMELCENNPQKEDKP